MSIHLISFRKLISSPYVFLTAVFWEEPYFPSRTLFYTQFKSPQENLSNPLWEAIKKCLTCSDCVSFMASERYAGLKKKQGTLIYVIILLLQDSSTSFNTLPATKRTGLRSNSATQLYLIPEKGFQKRILNFLKEGICDNQMEIDSYFTWRSWFF